VPHHVLLDVFVVERMRCGAVHASGRQRIGAKDRTDYQAGTSEALGPYYLPGY
jgi:hypothetical protein